MATCVRSVIIDTDGGLPGVRTEACMVHTHRWPCPRQGHPADPAPLHAYPPYTTRGQALRMWEIRTARQRPLIIHDMTRLADPDDHIFETRVLPCPCGPEILNPVPAALVSPRWS